MVPEKEAPMTLMRPLHYCITNQLSYSFELVNLHADKTLVEPKKVQWLKSPDKIGNTSGKPSSISMVMQ